MHVTQDALTPTNIKLTVVAEAAELDSIRQAVVAALSKNVRIPGFRPGKAPANLVEKNIDAQVLQSEFIDRAINQLYVDAITQQNLRPAAQPSISVTKFVPFNTMEFTAEVAVVGDIKLADYKKINLDRPAVKVTTKDVNEVLGRLQERAANKSAVERAAKKGDEVIIDFSGVDAASKEPISGADGQDYPLIIGSGSFIPGFEDELIGAKAGAVKTFDITFPDDYGAAALQGKLVTFTVTVKQVQELTQPALDDAFAAKVGPFDSLASLKSDIKKQLEAEKQSEADRTYDNELLEKIAEGSSVAISGALIEDEIDRMEAEEKRNVLYRGQTWEEHLADEGLTEEAHRAKQHDGAEMRVKAGLILSEIAQAENITVSQEELDIRLQLMRGQYSDPAMQAELDKPESRRDIYSRMMTEKTLDSLRAMTTKSDVLK